MQKRILIAAGGTGGHLYPAIGLANQLIAANPAIDILFAAGGLATNRFFSTSGFCFRSVEAGSFVKRSLLHCLKSCKAIMQGVWQSRKILAEYAPHLVIGFGSYHSFPLLVAAQLGNYPFLLHEQNSKPGKVIRLFAKKALLTGVYFPQAVEALPGPAVELAMPLREGYSLAAASKEEAFRYFGLHPGIKTILVFGGSQGARFLNETVSLALTKQAPKEFQVLHFTGEPEATLALQPFYRKFGIKAVVKTFEPMMKYAWSIADLAIARAGAGTIAEQMEFEVPALFVPYPFAADNHQESNADFLVNIVGGGWKCCELDFNFHHFSATLAGLLDKNSSKLQEKRDSIILYKSKNSRRQFSSIILKYLRDRQISLDI